MDDREQFRTRFMAQILGSQELTRDFIMSQLDNVLAEYDIERRDKPIDYTDYHTPSELNLYVSCKRLEGLSELTCQSYRRTLENFFKIMKLPIESIEANNVRMYLMNYKEQYRIKDRTLEYYRSTICRFFSWLTQEGYLQVNPLRNLKSIRYESHIRESLTAYQAEVLRSACADTRERAVVELMLATGARCSEVCALKIKDVDFNQHSVLLFGKGRKQRLAYINERAAVALKAYLNSRDDACPYLITTIRNPHRSLTSRALEQMLNTISDRCKNDIPHLSPHILRHTFATHALEHGMPVVELQQILGHSKTDTTMIYAHLSQESIAQSYRRSVV